LLISSQNKQKESGTIRIFRFVHSFSTRNLSQCGGRSRCRSSRGWRYAMSAAKSVSRITKVNWSTNWLSIYRRTRCWRRRRRRATWVLHRFARRRCIVKFRGDRRLAQLPRESERNNVRISATLSKLERWS